MLQIYSSIDNTRINFYAVLVGESILVCKPPEKMKGKKLMTSSLPPVKSCLVTNVDSDAEITSAIRRAILEVCVFVLTFCI